MNLSSNNKTKTIFLSSLGLIANSALATAAPADSSTHLVLAPDAESITQITDAVGQLSASHLEASFLKVYAGCKVDSASFEPVRVGVESVSAHVLSIHAQLEKV